MEDPDVVRAGEWLARAPKDPEAVVLGAPFAGGSISRASCHLAPAAVRAALGRFTIWSSDHEVSLDGLAVLDAGDAEVDPLGDVVAAQAAIERAVAALPAVPLVLLGGDNSVTVGGARGAGADALLTFDAHHDCRDPARRATNGSPVRQLVEGGLARVVQVGIHGFANGEPIARWAAEHGVRWVTASQARRRGIETTVTEALRALGEAGRIWVDVDLDCLDRAFAPGAPAALPGGLWPEHLERAAFLLGRDRRVRGMDIVELDPEADVAETTVRTAAAVMLSFLAGVASR